MQLTIQKWGNSAAVRLPTALLNITGFSIGDSIETNPVAGQLILLAAKPKYVLADLLAQCDPNAKSPSDMAAWENMQSVGREAA